MFVFYFKVTKRRRVGPNNSIPLKMAPNFPATSLPNNDSPNSRPLGDHSPSNECIYFLIFKIICIIYVFQILDSLGNGDGSSQDSSSCTQQFENRMEFHFNQVIFNKTI